MQLCLRTDVLNSPTKVLHVIPSVGPERGGPSEFMHTLTRGLARTGLDVHVATTDDNGPKRLDVPYGVPCLEEGATYWYFRRQTRCYTFSWPLTQWLAHRISGFDVVHIHALFSYATLPAALWSRRSGIPYIVRPLGTLSRWGMANRRPLLKKLSFRMLEGRILAAAAGVHYTSDQEFVEANELGIATSPLIVPNAVDLPSDKAQSVAGRFRQQHPKLEGRRIILFLSRLDRKKGLELLLEAFALVQSRCREAVLVLAGSGDLSWVKELREQTLRLGIEQSVVWAGFLGGDDKWAALADADVFVLPSYSENFGIAALEALACGLPVVVSDQVGIHREIAAAKAGLVTPCCAEKIAEALVEILHDKALRCRMRENGLRLAQEHFSLDAVSHQLRDIYRAILQ